MKLFQECGIINKRMASLSRKFFSFMGMFFALFFLIVPLFTSAFQIVPEACTGESANNVQTCGLCQIIETGINIFHFFVYGAGTIAVFFLVISGFRYIIASGQEDISSAKDSMTKTIFGLLIVLAAFVIVNSIMHAIAGGAQSTWYNFKC